MGEGSARTRSRRVAAPDDAGLGRRIDTSVDTAR